MNSGNTHPNLGQRDTPQDQQQQSTHGHANGQTHWHGAKKTKTELVIDFLGSPWCQRRGSNEEIRFSDAVFGWIDPVFMEQPEVSGVLGCIWILCWSNINPQGDVFRLQADDEVSLVSLSYKVLCFKHTIGSYWVPSQVPIDWSRPQSLALWTHSGAFQTAAVGAWRVDHKPFLGHQKKAAGSFCKLLVRQNPWDISSCFLFSRRLENNASEGDSELFLCILRWIPLCQHFCFFFVLLEHVSTHAIPWLQLMANWSQREMTQWMKYGLFQNWDIPPNCNFCIEIWCCATAQSLSQLWFSATHLSSILPLLLVESPCLLFKHE